MQDFCRKDSDLSSANSRAPRGAGYTSLWSTSEMQTFSMSNDLSLNMAIPSQRDDSQKQMAFQFQDQESSSTQSSGQSYQELASIGESIPFGQSLFSMQSEYGDGVYGKPEVSTLNSALSMGTGDSLLPLQFDHKQSLACMQHSTTEPLYGALLASYGPQMMVHHPEVVGMSSARVPLPLDLQQDGPIFVNPKQYNAILRRRERRAKLEAANKLAKARKPYLHESRHLHALKRARGSGGRFLNTKKLQQCKTNASESDSHRRQNCKDGGASTTSCSEITTDNNTFQQQDFRFSLYPNCAGNGDQHYLSLHR